MAFGDTITIMVDQGDTTRPVTLMASKKGRLVEWNVETQDKVQWLVATERTPHGTIIHEARVRLDRAIEIVTEYRARG